MKPREALWILFFTMPLCHSSLQIESSFYRNYSFDFCIAFHLLILADSLILLHDLALIIPEC